jgi:hypothetical protein
LRRGPAQAAGEAGRLLHNILEGGDFVGRDDAGRMVVVLAIEPRDFDRLMAFGADAVESEDGGDDEPYECPPMSPCWAWEGGPKFFGLPADQELDFVPPKQLGWMAQIARVVALGLLFVMVPGMDASAEQAPLISPLPMSTAQAPQQCCRVCSKGQACGDACISAARQCTKAPGCACSAGGESASGS